MLKPWLQLHTHLSCVKDPPLKSLSYINTVKNIYKLTYPSCSYVPAHVLVDILHNKEKEGLKIFTVNLLFIGFVYT